MFFSIFFNFLNAVFDILEYALVNQLDIFAPLLTPEPPEPPKPKKSPRMGL